MDIIKNFPEPYEWVTPEGWAGKYIIFIKDEEGANKFFQNILEWIVKNIDNNNQNVHWEKIGNALYFRFKNQTDLSKFLLVWG